MADQENQAANIEDNVFKSQYYPIKPSSLDSSSYANVDFV